MKHLTTIIKNLALPCTAIITMAACSDYAPEEYEGNFTKKEYETILEYSKNFENKYGKIDPQHNWGFDGLIQTRISGLTQTQDKAVTV